MKQHLRPIMFVGTCSDAVKALLTRRFAVFSSKMVINRHRSRHKICPSIPTLPRKAARWAGRKSYKRRPADISPHTDMNPILLKPTNDKSSQVVLNGKPVGNMSAKVISGYKTRRRSYLRKPSKPSSVWKLAITRSYWKEPEASPN